MSEKSENLETRVDDLEKKLDHIINILGIRSLQKEATPPPIPGSAKIYHTSEEKIAVTALPKAPVNFLPILAVICFFLAGIFIVKLAIDSGWMTPVRQWGFLTLFGVALVSFGLFFEKFDKHYRSYAGAAGITVLYLAAYSSFLYFGLFNPMIAIALGGLNSILCFYLLHYFKSELFVVICVVGTYISPVLLNKETDLIYLSGFFLIWAAIFSRLAIPFKTRSLTLMASYLGLGIFTALNLHVVEPDTLLLVILIQSMQFMIYAAGVYFYTVKDQSHLSKTEAIAYLPILLFFYGTIYYFLNIYNPAIAPWISLGFAGFIYLLYWQARKTVTNLESDTMVKSFFAVVLFHSGYVQLIPDYGKAWLLPVILLAMYISEQKEGMRKISVPLKIMFSAIAIIEFCRLCFTLITSSSLVSIAPSIATIGVGAFYYLKGAKAVKNKEGLFLSLLHIISILTLYSLGYEYGSLAVTALWAVYSICILIFGYTKRNAIVAKSSLIVLMVTCLKALVYDASQASSGSRIGSLILTGIVLYGAGYLFQKISKWTT
ncbi:MAG: DUF2339 domain-containing protein [Bdellovibrionales bacterium]|nr:DUF2339 domain-containing protein [Bdellovibrionales bacterium]